MVGCARAMDGCAGAMHGSARARNDGWRHASGEGSVKVNSGTSPRTSLFYSVLRSTVKVKVLFENYIASSSVWG